MALLCQTNSRIADASRNWQAVCNTDIIDWDKANEFIIATYALSNSVNPDSDFKLQWRRAGGSFADVDADTEVCWGTNTVLVDGTPLIVGTNTADCFANLDNGSIESEGDNLAYLSNIKSGDYGEIQWALGFGSGAQVGQEYEIQLVCIDFPGSAVCQTTITTTEISIPRIMSIQNTIFVVQNNAFKITG